MIDRANGRKNETRELEVPPSWLFLPTLAIAGFLAVSLRNWGPSQWLFLAAILLMLTCVARLITTAIELPLARICAVLVVTAWWTAFFIFIDWSLFTS